jgi:hypothetical protein
MDGRIKPGQDGDVGTDLPVSPKGRWYKPHNDRLHHPDLAEQ